MLGRHLRGVAAVQLPYKIEWVFTSSSSQAGAAGYGMKIPLIASNQLRFPKP